MNEPVLAAKGEHELFILPGMANRHGLISGATGTGKTVTLQVLAENFSMIGVPVFMADVKGDLAGLSRPGSENPKIAERINRIGLSNFVFGELPVIFWCPFGVQGHPVRTTISEMGPLLLSRLLNLNDTQTGVLTLVFEIADDGGLLLLDLKDLRSMLRYVGDNSSSFTTEYGNISRASIGAIQRSLIQLENDGGDVFFGEPSLNLDDFLQTDANGRGVINILAADKLIQSPAIYATFLLWLLSELFEQLSEAGDPEKPRLVFFFDEAHLLFDNAPKALLDKVEQVARLIRSKGVGVYFVTQIPLDIPDIILGQLGNKVQHALRAYTPRDQKAVRASAETFRTNPALDAERILTELGVGEALVSFLDKEGKPNIVERALIRPPFSRIGPVTPEERSTVIRNSLLHGVYERAVDRESAYEMLRDRAESAPAAKPASKSKPGRRSDSPIEAMAKSAARSVGRQVATGLVRGILGSFLGGRRRR